MVSTSCYRSAVVVIACHLPGRERALSLASRGYNVFRTAVFAEEVRDLEDASGARMSLIAFGVTKTDGITTWAEEVSGAPDGAGLSALFASSAAPPLARPPVSPSRQSAKSSIPALPVLCRS